MATTEESQAIGNYQLAVIRARWEADRREGTTICLSRSDWDAMWSEIMQRHENRSRRPARFNSWKAHEDAALREEYDRGIFNYAVRTAARTGRSHAACKCRARVLGLTQNTAWSAKTSE